MTIRVLIADDHAMVRDAIKGYLSKEPDIEIAADAADGDSTIALAAECSPDIALIDISMPGVGGIEATRTMVAANPSLGVIAVSMHSGQEYVIKMLQAGARGYLVKDSSLDEVLTAVRAVATGGFYISRSMLGQIMADYLRLLSNGPSSQAERACPCLTNRETEVLSLIAEGHTTKQIATRLQVSVKTIETHRRQIMEKTGIFSVVGLTKYALRSGLISLDE